VQQWAAEEDTLRDAVILKRVKEIRQQMPRIGTRKLYYMLSEILEKHGIKIGRDKLFDLLEEYGLLIRRRKRKKIATTNSNHPFYKYPNLIAELEVLRPNHLWVSDITYIDIPDDFCYLSLITDAYSKKIVGWCLYPTLQKEGPLQALAMAFNSLPTKLEQTLIHHSDRGTQYCSHEYTDRLVAKGINISMTERSDPYENAIAERVNGILKSEFFIDREFANIEQAQAAIASAIAIYNSMRPHGSCNNLTPGEAHQQHGELKSTWRKKKEVTAM
jgi:putative transposase